jgi:hypothetical protein
LKGIAAIGARGHDVVAVEDGRGRLSPWLGGNGRGARGRWLRKGGAFAQPLYVLVYVASMVVLAFHLMHGFQSAFQSMGLNHPKYMPIIKTVGIFFAVIAPLFFALIPVWMFVNASPVQ